MDRTLDFYDDDNLSMLSGSVEPPEYVKGASIRPRHDYDRFGIQLLTKEGQRNLFPIDGKASAWLSAQYFDRTQNHFSDEAQQKIASRIISASDRFDVDISDLGFVDDFDSEAKTASAPMMDASAALVETEPETKRAENFLFPDRERYPVDNEEQVKTAESYFNRHAQEMTPKRRKMFSNRLVKRAGELRVEIENEAIQKYASSQRTSDANIKLAFEARKEHLNDQNAKEGLDELYDTRDQLPPDVMAEALREFDKKAGIDNLWNSKFPDPYQSVQAGVEEAMDKTAASESITYQGTSFTADDLQAVSDDKLSEYFGEEQIEELKSNPVTVFESLPKTHKEIIVGLVQ